VRAPVSLRRALGLLLLAATLAPAAALAHSHKKRTLEIVHPWTTAMVEERVVNVPVYMKVKNEGREAERLLGAVTPHADKVELIEPRLVGGVKLPTASQAFTIPPRGELVLGPDGPRLLLSGFKKRLSAYDSFELTLVFEKAGRMVVEVAVEEAGPTARPPTRGGACCAASPSRGRASCRCRPTRRAPPSPA
jgi:copper(I)-binding protein